LREITAGWTLIIALHRWPKVEHQLPHRALLIVKAERSALLND